MKKLSYTLASLAIVGFSLLPANAVEKEIKNNTIVPDATEQIKQSTETENNLPCYPPFIMTGC